MSKTLYEKLCRRDRLFKAWNTLSKNPSSSGLSGHTIEAFSKNLDFEINLLKKQLTTKSFKFSKVKGAKIPKGNNSTSFRTIRIQEVRDRIVVKAITILISPIVEKKFKIKNEASFAYQTGLGPSKAFERIKSLYSSGHKFVLEADIIKFFDTIDKNFLLNEMVFLALPDDTLNNLITESLEQEIGNKELFTFEELQLFELSETGIPQGSSLSPLLSNIYLSKFDEIMLKNDLGLVRYADDFVVMCRTNSEAKKAYNKVKEILEGELKLEIHHLDNNDPKAKTKIVKPTQNPITFLSVVFDGNTIYPARKKYKELEENLLKLSLDSRISIVDYLTKYRLRIVGWISAFHFAEVERYFEKLENLVNQDIYQGLKIRDWELKNEVKNKSGAKSLSDKQRKYSGIPSCKEILNKIRGSDNKSVEESSKIFEKIRIEEVEKGIFELV